MSSQPTSRSSGTKGIGPHFSADATACTLVYQAHGCTHDEYRANLARAGFELMDWPENYPKPLMHKLWLDIEDLDDDATEPMVMSLEPPPPITIPDDEEKEG